MNPVAQKYGPPLLVLGAALYLGWPPSSPMELGENPVTAKAVRWKSSELDPPADISEVTDPFRPVLVAKEKPKPIVENVVIEPLGPSEEEIRGVVILTGIAKSGGRAWAILNGKASLAGDVIRTEEENMPACKLIAVNSDHVIVACQQKSVVIRPQVSRPNSKTKTRQSAAPASPEVDPTAPLPAAVPEPPTPDVETSPQA